MSLIELFIFLLTGAGICLTALGFSVFFSWYRDRRRLHRIAAEIVGSSSDLSEWVLRANNWVYRNGGFAKNKGNFLHPRLGPTPIAILKDGGDCADKSRLLLALLRELKIRATAVMLYDGPSGRPTHTVVEAHLGLKRMVADPVFDIVFPDRHGGYYGINALRSDPQLLEDRLGQLIALRGHEDKVAYYKRETESYRWPKTINLDKNAATRTFRRLLLNFSDDPELVKRPACLEDPKECVFILAATTAILCFLTASAVGLLISR